MEEVIALREENRHLKVALVNSRMQLYNLKEHMRTEMRQWLTAVDNVIAKLPEEL